MARRTLTVDRHEEIKRRLADGRGVREIAAAFTYHGFFRYSNGHIQSYDPSNSLATVPAAINAFGVVVGYYVDANNVYHGFLRIPTPLL